MNSTSEELKAELQPEINGQAIKENSDEENSEKIRTARPAIGFLLCLFAEIFYFFANFQIRCMTDYQEISPDWTLMVKESVTVAMTLPIILWFYWKKQYRFPTWKILGLILVAAFVCEFLSSRAFFRSYAILGVVLAMPLYVTFQILGSNFFATTLIGEKITRLKIITTVVLIAAVLFLALSKWNIAPNADLANNTSEVTNNISNSSNNTSNNTSNINVPTNSGQSGENASPQSAANQLNGQSTVQSSVAVAQIGGSIASSRLLIGILVTLISGGASALYMCIMRGVMRTGGQTQVPLTLSMCLITGSGMLIAAICLLFERGTDGFRNVPLQCWLLSLGAGVANLIGFYFRNLGFRYVSASKIVFVSVLQVLLLTVFGISYFGEQSNSLIWYGLALTVLGIVLAGFTK